MSIACLKRARFTFTSLGSSFGLKLFKNKPRKEISMENEEKGKLGERKGKHFLNGWLYRLEFANMLRILMESF